MKKTKKKTWYADGLDFTCVQCGACCSGEPGYVWVSKEDRKKIDAFLDLEPGEFKKRYTRAWFGRVSLKEHENGDCCLLGPEGCLVYSVRPVQCRTWPFWPCNLKTRKAWNETARNCAGMNSGRHRDLEEIKKTLRLHRTGVR